MQNIAVNIWKNLIMNKGKKFDIIFANPPFNLGVKMLTKWFDIANEICTVQPSTWLLGKQQKKDIVKHVDNWEKTEIESIQGSEHFDAAIGGEVAIQHFIKGTENNSHYDKQKRIKFDGKFYKECREINKFSNDDLLMEFKSIVEPLYLKDNIVNHLKTLPFSKYKKYHDSNNYNGKYILRIPRFAGDGHRGITPDYYTILPKTHINDSIGEFTEMLKKTFIYNGGKIKKFVEFFFIFDNIKIAKNFKNYILTDFCRICLYLKKFNIELIGGEPLNGIPWFNFSDPIFSKSPAEIDDYLFKKYNISDEIRKHIEEILTDYYGIRK